MPLHRITSPQSLPERILIYGDPKTGKTRLATSLPDRFGDILYFAADPGSESLSSVLRLYRHRLVVVKPGPDPSKPNQKYDPDVDAFTFALFDWSKELPLVRTVVWDTLTATSFDILSQLADSGAFSESKHIAIGSDASRQNIAMQGDYGAAQNRIDRLMDFLFRIPQHLIVVCHAKMDESRNGEGLEGGPATVGSATVRKFPGRFDTVIHTHRTYSPSKTPGGPAETKLAAFTSRHSFWSAGIRGSIPTNPIPVVPLDPDPINFWNLFDSHFRKELV